MRERQRSSSRIRRTISRRGSRIVEEQNEKNRSFHQEFLYSINNEEIQSLKEKEPPQKQGFFPPVGIV
jgi:hypothetical protein